MFHVVDLAHTAVVLARSLISRMPRCPVCYCFKMLCLSFSDMNIFSLCDHSIFNGNFISERPELSKWRVNVTYSLKLSIYNNSYQVLQFWVHSWSCLNFINFAGLETDLYSIVKLCPWNFSSILCRLGEADVSFFLMVISRGLWSETSSVEVRFESVHSKTHT